MKRPLVFPLVLLLSSLAHSGADELTGRIAASDVVAAAGPTAEPKFQAITLDDKVQIGYGVAVADVDGDKLPDILLADKKQFVWYRNPGPAKAADPTAWKKYVIAENLTPKDNVCIAARDIDGDGKCEIAVGAEWNPGDTENSGAVFYLIPPADRTQLWTPVKLPHEPTVHRMKWVKGREGKWCLVVLPLHGRGNVKGEGAGVKILSYTPPAALNDPKGEWKTEAINGDAQLHMTHNFEPSSFGPNPNSKEDPLYIGSKEGISVLYYAQETWRAMPSIRAGEAGPSKGVGELRTCLPSTGVATFAAVEPMHGNELVEYVLQSPPSAEKSYRRTVLTDKLSEGHALACGDLIGAKAQQIVIGWRGNPTNPTPDNIGIKVFTPLDVERTKWRETLIDNKIACEDLVLADLNGDGKLDIVGAGRATHNLKIYLNQTAPPPVANINLPKGD